MPWCAVKAYNVETQNPRVFLSPWEASLNEYSPTHNFVYADNFNLFIISLYSKAENCQFATHEITQISMGMLVA